MTNRKLPKHLETIINEACWGVPGVGQLTGEAKLRAILAEQEPCQRCWGEGKEERAIVDFSSATQTEPCPDCNLSDDHRMIEEEMNDA